MLINNMHLNLNNFFRFFNYSRLINNIVILFVGFWIKVFILNANVAPIDYVDISQQKAEMKQGRMPRRPGVVQAADYAVSKGVNEVSWNLEDNKSLYQM